jgi:hypothetical protein
LIKNANYLNFNEIISLHNLGMIPAEIMKYLTVKDQTAAAQKIESQLQSLKEVLEL